MRKKVDWTLKKKGGAAAAATLLGFSIISGCGGSDPAEVISAVVDITGGYPSGLAVTSPTSGGTSSKPSFKVGEAGSPLYAGTVEADATFVAKNSAYAAIIAGTSAASCEVTLPPMSISGAVDCYGPALDYENHPDPAGSSGGNGQLPTGDLGIWSSTEGGTEACAAAKINSLIENTATKVDNQMLLAASMLCIMKRAGTALPTSDGDSVTLTTELNTAIQVNNPTVTISLAKLENLADVTDSGTAREVFKFSITTSNSAGPNTVSTSSYMKHMPTSLSNGTFKGRLWAEITGLSGAGDKDAYAITYEKSSSTSLKHRMLSATYQGAGASTVIFDSSGDLLVTGGWTANIGQGIINVDPSTGLGSFSYGWQAGTGDDRARIFNGFTQSASGCGFFGYGGRFDNTAVTGTLSDNIIDGFICNWAGPGNSHNMTSTANKAQKQCMTVNSTSGLFMVDPLKESITYTPTLSCDRTAVQAFGTKLTSESTFSTGDVVNDLVDLTGDADFAGYSAPSAPILPAGL